MREGSRDLWPGGRGATCAVGRSAARDQARRAAVVIASDDSTLGDSEDLSCRARC
jgi:hypothetical protein